MKRSPPPISAELKAAVERAYAVFGNYRPGPQLAVCRCGMCMDPETEQQLLTTPLRAIDQRLLSKYMWAAYDETNRNGISNEMLVFAPRFFDLVASGSPPHFTDPCQTLRRLSQIGFRELWTTPEIQTVDSVFEAYFRNELPKPIGWYKTQMGHENPYSEITDTLCLLAYGGADMMSLLAVWDKDTSMNATAHIAATLSDLSWGMNSGLQLADPEPAPFWGDLRPQWETVTHWLVRRVNAERIYQAIDSIDDSKVAKLFGDAYDFILTQHPAKT